MSNTGGDRRASTVLGAALVRSPGAFVNGTLSGPRIPEVIELCDAMQKSRSPMSRGEGVGLEEGKFKLGVGLT